MGISSPQPEYHSNFKFDMDPYLVDDATKTPVSNGQNPVDLLTDSLFSCEGDWVLDALSGTGTPFSPTTSKFVMAANKF